MSTNGHSTVNIRRGVPPDLKARIVDDVKTSGQSQNDVVVVILARHFNVPFAPATGVSGPGPGLASEQLLLRVPSALKQKLLIHAENQHVSVGRLVLSVLCAHYGVRIPAPAPRGRRQRRVAAA